MVEEEAKAMAAEFVRAKEGQTSLELMKKFAEKAEMNTLHQIGSDSADLELEGMWRMIRVDSDKLEILSSARSFLEIDISILECRLKHKSLEVSSLRRRAMINKRNIATLEKGKGKGKGKGKAETSYKKLVNKQIISEERELESIEGEIREANNRWPFRLHRLNKQKADVEASLEDLRKRIADLEDLEASYNASLAELVDNRRVIEGKLIAMGKDEAALRETLELKTDALGYCRTAVAMTEQVYLRRLRKLGSNVGGYVELVDSNDVNVLQSICAKSSSCGGVVLKFYVMKDKLLEPIAKAVKKRRFVPRLDRLYELSVDENGKCSVFEQSVEEDAAYGFKRTTEKNTKRKASPVKNPSSKRSKGDVENHVESEILIKKTDSDQIQEEEKNGELVNA